MKKTLIAIASILAIVAGCQKTTIDQKIADGKIYASIEDGTKATLSTDGQDSFMVWSDKDTISLFDGTSNIKCSLTSESGKKFGTFEPATTPEAVATYYAVAPYDTVATLVDGTLTVEYPSTIVYDPAKGPAEGGVNIMVAKSTSYNDIKFKNLCGYIKFDITGEAGQKVSKIFIYGEDSQPVNGKATVTFGEGGEPSVAFGTTGTSTVTTVEFAEDVELSATPLSLTLAVAPVYNKGFHVTVVLADGRKHQLVSTTTIGRNEIVNMPAVVFSAVDVAEIGTEKYKTIADAVEAANKAETDVTIKVLSNTSANADTVKNTNCVTLDLNGKTIFGNIVVDSLASFKLKDGVSGGCIKNEMNALKVLACATFVMDGGIIESTSTVNGSSATPLVVSAGAEASVAQTKVSLISGKIIGKTNYGSLYAKYSTVSIKDGFEIEGDRCIFATNGSVITIDGGKFTARQSIHYGHKTAVVNVNGGEFTATEAIASLATASGNHNVVGGYFDAPLNTTGSYVANVSISGGYYTFEPDHVLAGYEAKKLEEPIVYHGKSYTHTIAISSKTVARLTIGGNSEDFTTIEAALAKAKTEGGSSTLSLLDSVSMSDMVTLDCAIDLTFDLNGFTIDVNSNRIDVNHADAKFTIMNSGSTGEYRMALKSEVYPIKVIAGSLTIQNVFLRNNGQYAAIHVNTGASFTMNGGRIESSHEKGKGFLSMGNTVINGGTIVTENYTLYLQGGTTTVHGGEFISNAAHCVYMYSAKCTTNIDGGAFVAKTDGKYSVYATTKEIAHITNISKTDTTEPVFYSINTATGDNQGRAIYNAYSVSKVYTSAGYFASPNLGKAASPNTYVKTGYKRETLSTPEKRVIDGVEYTFIMRVVPDEE